MAPFFCRFKTNYFILEIQLEIQKQKTDIYDRQQENVSCQYFIGNITQ